MTDTGGLVARLRTAADLLDEVTRRYVHSSSISEAIETILIQRKMLHYIAFVAAGDENADAQLAVDRLKTELEALRASAPPEGGQDDMAEIIRRVRAAACGCISSGGSKTCREQYGVGSWCSECLAHELADRVAPEGGQGGDTGPKDWDTYFAGKCVLCGQSGGCHCEFEEDHAPSCEKYHHEFIPVAPEGGQGAADLADVVNTLCQAIEGHRAGALTAAGLWHRGEDSGSPRGLLKAARRGVAVREVPRQEAPQARGGKMTDYKPTKAQRAQLTYKQKCVDAGYAAATERWAADVMTILSDPHLSADELRMKLRAVLNTNGLSPLGGRERLPSAWGDWNDGHDYSCSGKHDPLYCRMCLRDALRRAAPAGGETNTEDRA